MGTENTVHANDARSSGLLASAAQGAARSSPIVLVSGGFDPLHIGHVALLRHACLFGVVVVALNSDAWLTRKKGRPFMKWDDRRDILLACRFVADVIAVDDANGTVAQAIYTLKPDFFCNGGDRSTPNYHENIACEKLKVQQLFGIGGEKVRSSSSFIAAARAP